MFFLDVTLTHGALITFILYANLVGINSKLLLSASSTPSMPLYIIISLANFNLGIPHVAAVSVSYLPYYHLNNNYYHWTLYQNTIHTEDHITKRISCTGHIVIVDIH